MNYLSESGLYHLLRILKNWIQDKIINNLTNQIINLSKIENQHYNQLLNKKIDFYYDISTPIPFGFNNFKRNTYFKGINIPTINPNSLVHIIIYTTKYHTSSYYPNYTIWQGTSKEIIDNINNLSKLNDVFSKQYVKVSITSSGELKFEIRISNLEMTFTHIDGVTSYVQIAKEFLPQHIDWNESYYKNGAHIKNKPFGYLPIITHKPGVYSIIGDTVKIHKNNTSYDLKLTPYKNINIGEAGRSILLYLSDNELYITNDTNLNTIEIEIPNIKQIEEKYIPDTVVKTTPQTLSNTDKNQALANLGIDPVVWKYMCDPCIIKSGKKVPEELIGDFDEEQQYFYFKYPYKNMYVVDFRGHRINLTEADVISIKANGCIENATNEINIVYVEVWIDKDKEWNVEG